MSAANTMDVFREAIGKRVVGFYTEPRREHAGNVAVLVLDDGTGLAYGTGNGSHWIVSVEDVQMRARARRAELEQLERDLREVLATEAVLSSGAKPQEGTP